MEAIAELWVDTEPDDEAELVPVERNEEEIAARLASVKLVDDEIAAVSAASEAAAAAADAEAERVASEQAAASSERSPEERAEVGEGTVH